jgi:hypothetical protein
LITWGYCLGGAGPDLFSDAAALGQSQVVIVLQVEPELCGQAEILSQTDSGVGTDGPVSADDVVDAGERKRLRQGLSGYAHGFHEFGLENLAGMDRENPA